MYFLLKMWAFVLHSITTDRRLPHRDQTMHVLDISSYFFACGDTQKDKLLY